MMSGTDLSEKAQFCGKDPYEIEVFCLTPFRVLQSHGTGS